VLLFWSAVIILCVFVRVRVCVCVCVCVHVCVRVCMMGLSDSPLHNDFAHKTNDSNSPNSAEPQQCGGIPRYDAADS
jgi:hypothetical protein